MELKDGQASRKMNGKVTKLPSSSAKKIKKGLRRNYLNIARSSDTLTATLMGRETMNDTSYIKLVIKDLDPTPTLYIHPDTHLPYMLTYSQFSSQRGSRVTMKTYFDAWKTRNGITYPFKQSTYSDDTKISQTDVKNLKVILE